MADSCEYMAKPIYFCFIDYAKAFDCMDHNTLWKILKGMGIPDPWPAWHDWVTELTDEGDSLFSVFITLSVIYPYYFFPSFIERPLTYSTVYF